MNYQKYRVKILAFFSAVKHNLRFLKRIINQGEIISPIIGRTEKKVNRVTSIGQHFLITGVDAALQMILDYYLLSQAAACPTPIAWRSAPSWPRSAPALAYGRAHARARPAAPTPPSPGAGVHSSPPRAQRAAVPARFALVV